MATAIVSSDVRQPLLEVNPDGSQYFTEKLVSQIYSHYDNQKLIDVKFRLNNSTILIPAHRLILASASPYFEELFCTEKGNGPVIEIDNIDSDTFERLITFCYSGKTLVTLANVDRMLKAALILQLDDAVSDCVGFLIEHITDYTLQRAFALESETLCPLLNEKLLEYVIENFTEVIQSADFLNMDPTKLQQVLESEELSIRSEKVAFKAVQRWFDHYQSGRKLHLPNLIACLRLTQFDGNFIMNHIQPLPGCELLALKAIAWRTQPESRSKVTLKYTNKRGEGNEIIEESLLVLKLEENNGSIYQYKTDDTWDKCFDMEIYSRDCQALYMNDNLILIGGIHNKEASNKVSSWDFRTRRLQQLEPMKQPRFCHSVAVLGDTIYAIGGMKYCPKDSSGPKTEVLNTVEVYSKFTGWALISNMVTPRSKAGAAVINGQIYIIGGCNESENLSSVECYDPTTNCWNGCANMIEAHWNPGVAVHNGQIFVVSGWSSEQTGTVERYDPCRNVWTKIASLSPARWRLGCISVDNKLWAVGGEFSNAVSVYNEQRDAWYDRKPLPSAGPYYCFTVPKILLESESSVNDKSDEDNEIIN